MKRLPQLVLVGSTVGLSWLGMMAVHECGHVLGACLTGGAVSRVVLHPLTISRTDLSANPHPLLVAWAGPAVGVLVPLVVLGVASLARWPGTYLVRFFAGFCLVANGAYIGAGSFGGIGDAGDMLRQGSPAWPLWAFGVLTAPTGLGLWRNLGPHFGFGAAEGRVSRRATWVTASFLTVVVVLESLLGGE